MAGQDELVYRIVFTADETSLKEVQDQVNAIQQTISQAKPGEGGIGAIAIDAKASVTSLVQLDKQIKATRGELKLLDAQRKIGIQLTDEQLDQEQKLKVELKATTQAYNRQTQSLASIAAASSTAATTYNELVARNKALSAELRDLPLDDTTGKLAELQAEYARNNERLKEFDRTMGNHQRNVGNYERALQGVTIGTQKLGMAFKSSGVGLVATAFNQVTQSVKTFEPFADGIADSFKVIGTAVTTVLNRIKTLSGAFDALKNFEFRKALDIVQEGFKGIGEEIQNNVKSTVELSAAERDELVQLSEVNLKRAQTNRDLAEAKLLTKDLNLSVEERIDALKQVMTAEETQIQKELDFHAQRVARLQAELDINKENREAEIALNEAKAEQAQVEEQSFNRRKELQSELNTLEKQQADDEKKIAAEKIAAAESVANSTLGIGKAIFGETKALRVAEAIMDTYRGATSAYANAPGGPGIKALAAAAAVAAGLANVKKIMQTKPGSGMSGGGSSSPSISNVPSRSPGGEPAGMTAIGSMYAPGNVRAGEVALQTAGALDAFANRGAPMINVEAKVDREGMAIAVREGEQGLLNQTITYQ